MAKDYDDFPVVFLEYDYDGDFPTRIQRWDAAYGGGNPLTPWIMVDSGNQYTSGPVDYYTVYSAMVDNSLVRPPQAAVEASAWRTGDEMGFYVQVQNLAGVALSPANDATIHGLVYEDTDVGVTSRYVRAVVSTSIANLEPGTTATYTFETEELEGVNWEKLHTIVLVDYIPSGSPGAYDMLQAAQAVLMPEPFSVEPNPLWFLVDPSDPPDPTASLHIEGARFVNWSAVESVDWLTVSPATGSYDTHPLVTIDTDLLTPGLQQGVIGFSTLDDFFADYVIVDVYYAPLEHSYLPLVNK